MHSLTRVYERACVGLCLLEGENLNETRQVMILIQMNNMQSVVFCLYFRYSNCLYLTFTQTLPHGSSSCLVSALQIP